MCYPSFIRSDLEARYTVAIGLGLRKGEALGLRWQDIDFAERCIMTWEHSTRRSGYRSGCNVLINYRYTHQLRTVFSANDSISSEQARQKWMKHRAPRRVLTGLAR